MVIWGTKYMYRKYPVQGRASNQTGSAESALPVCTHSQNGELWHEILKSVQKKCGKNYLQGFVKTHKIGGLNYYMSHVSSNPKSFEVCTIPNT